MDAKALFKLLIAKHEGDAVAARAEMDAILADRKTRAHAMAIGEVADRLGIEGLRAASGERVGPCPVCGGRDRFSINARKNVFLCRQCDEGHGGPVNLVRLVMGCDYPAAIDWLLGEVDLGVSPEELARRAERARAVEAKRAGDAARYRRRAIKDAQAIWSRARDGNIGVVRAYLAARGIDAEMLPRVPRVLRFIADHPYVKVQARQLVTMHRGPAMIAAVQAPDGTVTAVHQTWVDRAPPHGKAQISYGGEAQAAKLVRGSKKGGAIRLYTPEGANALVMGEGIETTLSALAARALPRAAYWAGVDLGNMSGQMLKLGTGRWSGVPDLADREAFVPPPWVERLVFIMDGDSEPGMTRAKLEAGLRRAMAHRPGLVGQIVAAGRGVDLNDVLVGAGGAT